MATHLSKHAYQCNRADFSLFRESQHWHFFHRSQRWHAALTLSLLPLPTSPPRADMLSPAHLSPAVTSSAISQTVKWRYRRQCCCFSHGLSTTPTLSHGHRVIRLRHRRRIFTEPTTQRLCLDAHHLHRRERLFTFASERPSRPSGRGGPWLRQKGRAAHPCSRLLIKLESIVLPSTPTERIPVSGIETISAWTTSPATISDTGIDRL